MNEQRSDHHSFLSFGDNLIAQTRELILSLWEKESIASELKEDRTPVSEVDIACEELARSLIRNKFPDHGIVGEELGTENPDAEFVWTIDPIDGTQNLVNRIPTFGTILGLLHRGRPILGWIDHPVLGEFLRGGPGIGAVRNGTPFVLNDILAPELSATDIIGTNCPATFECGGHLDVLWTILKFHPHVRIYYDVYSHSLAILGSLAVMVEYNLKIWDLSASRALVEGAGGEYHELGREEISGKPTMYHAAFGKKRAVKLISAEILG